MMHKKTGFGGMIGIFSGKIHQLFALLGGKLTEFARAAGCDKSNISHITNGGRIPNNGGAGSRRLVHTGNC